MWRMVLLGNILNKLIISIMEQVKVNSTIKKGEVYVKLGDVVKALLTDFAELPDDEDAIKKYIKHSVGVWEKYENDIIEMASK